MSTPASSYTLAGACLSEFDDEAEARQAFADAVAAGADALVLLVQTEAGEPASVLAVHPRRYRTEYDVVCQPRDGNLQ